jgi:hypothetical protein
MLSGSRRLVRFRLRGKRFTGDKQNRAFCALEQFRRHLAEEELVASPWAYTHHQKIVMADLELTKNGLLRLANTAHRALYLDPVMIAQSDNLADDSVGTRRRSECGANVALP